MSPNVLERRINFVKWKIAQRNNQSTAQNRTSNIREQNRTDPLVTLDNPIEDLHRRGISQRNNRALSHIPHPIDHRPQIHRP
jgi:hypothetical protein